MTENNQGQLAGNATGLGDQDGRAQMEGHQEIEVILVRQLAGYLALPVVILDPQGTVIYYNEPAERILARRFDEGGPIPPTHWAADFEFAYESGEPLPLEEMTLVAALRTRELVHMNFRLRGLDKVRHHVASAGIPLIGNAGRFLGVAAFFFELDT